MIYRVSEKIQRLRPWLRLHRATLFDVLLILVVGLLAITWFRGDYLILFGDWDFYPNWRATFFRTFFSWDPEGLGTANTRVLAALIPYEAFRAFSLGFLGLSPVVAEKILFYLSFTLSGLSMYYLVRVTGERRRIVGLSAAFFYMLNPYTLLLTWGGGIGYNMFFYASFPLILALFIKGLNEQRGYKYAFFFCLLWLVTTTSSHVNPKWLLLTWVLLISYLIFYILTNRNRQRILYSLRFTGVLFSFWLILNLYWLIPNFYIFPHELGSTFAVYKATGAPDILQSWRDGSLPSISDAMRLTGLYSLHARMAGDPFYLWASAYLSPLFLFIGFLMPLLAFFSVLSQPRNKHVIFFALVALAVIFQLKGPNPPLGQVTQWFFTNIPLLRYLTVSPLWNFSPALTLSYGFLIGYGIGSLYHLIDGRKGIIHGFARQWRAILSYTGKVIAVIIAILILGVNVWPLWTGDSIYTGGKVTPSARIRIPDYYNEAADWLGEQEGDFRIFTLPLHKIYNVAYSWEHGFVGTDPTFRLLPKTVIISGLEGHNFGTTMSEWITQDATADVGKILTLMNAKYIIFHRDANMTYMTAVPWYIPTTLEKLESILSSQKGIKLEKSFGKLDFYRNEYWQPSHLYATTDIIFIDGDREALILLAAIGGLDAPSAIFLSDLGEGGNQFASDKANRSLTSLPKEQADYRLNITTTLPQVSENDFETGDFGGWLTSGTPAIVTSSDGHSGNYSLQASIPPSNMSSIYTDFSYDGNSPININAWMKVVSRVTPAGAFIYLRGYDAEDLERVRIIYHTYDNWDTPTGAPGEHPEYGAYSHYSLKVDLGKPPYDAWINVNQNPRDEFEARFPGVWEKLGLTKIRLDLNNWGDGAITSRYDDVRISGISSYVVKANLSYNLSVPKEGRYELFASVERDFNEAMQYKIDDGEPQAFTPEILTAGRYFNLAKIGESWLGEGRHTVQFVFEKREEYTESNFETGDFGGWLASSGAPATATSSDSHSGNYSLQVSIPPSNIRYIYKDFNYDGKGPINVNAWMKIVSRITPAGAFIYLRGYDAEGVERVRIMYHTYDNWDTPTGVPGQHPEYGAYPYYSLKVSIGNPPLDTWINVNQNPRDEFEARFPGIWEKLGLTRIRLELKNWGDGGITSRYDDVKISGVLYNPINYVSALPKQEETYYVPEISFQRINPTKLLVQVNTSQPFFLVFSESYHPQWKAYYGKVSWIEALFKKPVSADKHLKVNGYANAWYIDRVGDYDMTLYFQTQSSFYIGAIISSLSLAGSLGYLVWRRRRGDRFSIRK